MDIQIKEIEPCKLSVHYEADAEAILNKRGEVLKHFKKAPVPGFRKGKSTLDAIKVHYRTQIEESVTRGMAEDAYHNTLFEKKLRPHGAPKFNSALIADGKFVCDFDLNVKPDFELKEYRDFDLPKPQAQMSTPELTERMMQELRVRFGNSVPYTEEDFVQKGDNIIIDYDGFIDGQKVESISKQGEMFTVGSSQLIEFDNNVLGLKMGETREFDFVVPEQGLPSLIGKTIHFVVTLTMGSKNEPCPLNDELAHKLGKEDFSELKEFVASSAAAKMSIMQKSQITDAISHVLVDKNVFDVPNWLTLSEAKYLAHQSKMEWDLLSDVDKDRFIQIAEKNVRLSLILDKIRDIEPEAQISDQEVFDIIKRNISQSKSEADPNAVIQEMSRTGYLQILFSRIKDEYTLDFITKTIKVIE